MSARLGIAVGLPTRLAGVEGSVLVEWAVRAEAGPFSSLAVTDRVVYDTNEALVALAVAAGATHRIRLVTSILLAPTRETTLLARQAASLDVLSGGRLTLGVGVGLRRDDYQATGFAFEHRGRRLDEQLAELRRIWARERPSPAGGSIGPTGPAPSRPAGPEVLIGGYVDAVARRIAAWGDGFMAPGGGDPARMAELWVRILEAWAAAGRAGRPRWIGAQYFALGPRATDIARSYIDAWYGFAPELAARRLRGILTGPEAIETALRAQAELGVDEFILRPCAPDLDQLDRLADLLGGRWL